ncbi:MAG: hypothetical protein MZV63_35000 [Marinilabiliales bacterium]|nr:hypothetical protein [Marinilabiliales bacterium]
MTVSLITLVSNASGAIFSASPAELSVEQSSTIITSACSTKGGIRVSL